MKYSVIELENKKLAKMIMRLFKVKGKSEKCIECGYKKIPIRLVEERKRGNEDVFKYELAERGKADAYICNNICCKQFGKLND